VAAPSSSEIARQPQLAKAKQEEQLSLAVQTENSKEIVRKRRRRAPSEDAHRLPTLSPSES
jgi:hypothetical protein